MYGGDESSALVVDVGYDSAPQRTRLLGGVVV
jgi:hypothetical protein